MGTLAWQLNVGFNCLVFAASLLNLSRKKEEERFLGRLKWELWLGYSMLGSINLLQKQDTKINLHTNL